MIKIIPKKFKEKYNRCESIVEVEPQIINETNDYLEVLVHLSTLFTVKTELYLSSIEYVMTIDRIDFIVTDMKVLKYNNELANTYIEHTPHNILETWIKNPNEFGKDLNLPLDFTDCFISTAFVFEKLNTYLSNNLNKDIYLISDDNNYEFCISILGRTDKRQACLYIDIHNPNYVNITVKFFGCSTRQYFEYPINYNNILPLVFYTLYNQFYSGLKEGETIMEKYKHNKMVLNFINIYEDKLKIY